MRKAIFLVVCLITLAVMISCESAAGSPSAIPTASVSAEISKVPASEPAATPAVGTAAPTSEPISTTVPAATPAAPSASAGAELYSSYAHMVSFDPAKGMASFDYFDMLRGDGAVNWLVEHQGYSQSEAEDEVADYADSEFVEKNTNPQLREINLQNVPVTLMYDPDTGNMLEPAEPLQGTLIDLYNLYELDHSLVTDSFFYWIEVKNGKVESVEQVY
ncbi:MAG: hypothetical protein AAGU32_19235, partial [Bacillota bacterium]